MQITPRDSLTIKAINLSRINKRILAIFLDMSVCLFTTWIAISLRLNELVVVNWQYSIPALVSICIAIPVFFLFGFYKVIYRYVNHDMLQVLTKAIAVYTIIYSIIFWLRIIFITLLY